MPRDEAIQLLWSGKQTAANTELTESSNAFPRVIVGSGRSDQPVTPSVGDWLADMYPKGYDRVRYELSRFTDIQLFFLVDIDA
ncbi:hypothetical protein M2D63_023215 [Pseudomonas sp. BJa5]|uniref:hypothetical protein n=1 Tax=Pseudomonas sp. BJa5 TaxID=2936270 RepID=UPI002559F939|nr:hypothetical protein [Pseudomonas sp. BGr12]MDL2424026.1 hypothetical protein [Pseudomonas sp. BGr12]